MTEEIFFEVGARIAALRGAMKQSEFAERLGVNRQTVGRWEAGERLPDGSGLLRMREAFGADINVILTGQAGGVAPALRPDEEQLLEHYRAAHSDARERIRQIAATAANSPKRGSKEAALPDGAPKPAAPRTVVTIGKQYGNSYAMSVDGSNGGNVSLGDMVFGSAKPPKKGSAP